MDAAGFKAAALALACAACTSTAVNERTFEGTRWRVTAINGQAAPAAVGFIQFRNGQISGGFGCNNWGGVYSVAGETLIARAASTLKACEDNAIGAFEDQGLAVLRQPMRWTWPSGQRLTLSNAAGSIELERVP